MPPTILGGNSHASTSIFTLSLPCQLTLTNYYLLLKNNQLLMRKLMLESWLSLLQEYRVIAVIRADNFEVGKKMAHTAIMAGIKLIEVTWNSFQPERLIVYLRNQFPDCYVGAGTILHFEDLQMALNAQAQFIFSPHFNQDLVTFAHSNDIPFIPGTFSPTEIIKAFEGGAKVVKIFPVQAVGGVNYVKSLQGPMAQFPLIPTGGIKMSETIDFIQAGAIAVGLSTDLFPPHLILSEQWEIMGDRISQLQKQLVINKLQ